jgi:uncharacterized OsmC-like protein
MPLKAVDRFGATEQSSRLSRPCLAARRQSPMIELRATAVNERLAAAWSSSGRRRRADDRLGADVLRGRGPAVRDHHSGPAASYDLRGAGCGEALGRPGPAGRWRACVGLVNAGCGLTTIVRVQSDELRSLQAPLKERYRSDPDAAVVTLSAVGILGDGVTCSVQTARAIAEAGLQPATSGDGSLLCSGDMLLEALVACAGVTLRAVATSLGIAVTGGRVRAEGDLDFRGTLGVDREVPVGFSAIRLSFSLDTDASAEQVATLQRLTERFCVVYQTLKAGPSLSTTSPRPRRHGLRSVRIYGSKWPVPPRHHDGDWGMFMPRGSRRAAGGQPNSRHAAAELGCPAVGSSNQSRAPLSLSIPTTRIRPLANVMALKWGDRFGDEAIAAICRGRRRGRRSLSPSCERAGLSVATLGTSARSGNQRRDASCEAGSRSRPPR